MSHITSDAVHNGERLPVVCDFYTGPAGVRADDRGGEFACAGSADAFFGFVVGTGTVGTRRVNITSIRKSTTATGIVVARFTYAEDTAA